MLRSIESTPGVLVAVENVARVDVAHAVEEHVDGSELACQRGDRERIARVEAAPLAMLERRELVEIDVAGDDPRAFANEELGGRAPYSLGGGGDERGFSGEP